jgi:hypothetical protein
MKWEHLPQKLIRDSGRKYEKENLESACEMSSGVILPFGGYLRENSLKPKTIPFLWRKEGGRNAIHGYCFL